jgi:hypothetical protein
MHEAEVVAHQPRRACWRCQELVRAGIVGYTFAMTRDERGDVMTSSADSDRSEPEDVPGEESEIRGDNPGVGGVPAKDVEFAPETQENDPEDEASRGDNPGVGGVPAKDVGGGE